MLLQHTLVRFVGIFGLWAFSDVSSLEDRLLPFWCVGSLLCELASERALLRVLLFVLGDAPMTLRDASVLTGI